MASVNPLNTLRYDVGLCTGCGMCCHVCPHGVFEMDGKVAHLARLAACMECGACQLNCPTGAITVDSGASCAAALISAALRGKRLSVPRACGCGDTPEAC